MDDLISRQDVLDKAHPYGNGDAPDGFCVDVEDIQALPSAQRKGKWIQNDNGTYSCSLCHSWIPEEQYHYARFCLYCGASGER